MDHPKYMWNENKTSLEGEMGHPEPSQNDAAKKGVKTGDQSPEPQTEKMRNHPQRARRTLLLLNIMSMEGMTVDTWVSACIPVGIAHAHTGDTGDWDSKVQR